MNPLKTDGLLSTGTHGATRYTPRASTTRNGHPPLLSKSPSACPKQVFPVNHAGGQARIIWNLHLRQGVVDSQAKKKEPPSESHQILLVTRDPHGCV